MTSNLIRASLAVYCGNIFSNIINIDVTISAVWSFFHFIYTVVDIKVLKLSRLDGCGHFTEYRRVLFNSFKKDMGNILK